LEVILVDNHNHPNRDTQKTYAWFLEHSKLSDANHLKYIHQPFKGLSHARNAGIANSKGKILCFIDDDAIAPFDWLEKIMCAFAKHPEAGVIGGHIILNIPEPRPKVLKPGFEIYWSHFVTKFKDYTEVDNWDEFPWGANWCARRTALLAIGGFPVNYGRQGNNFWGGEELVAATLIHRLGYKVAILPQAEVLHNVDPSRYNLKHIWGIILADKLVHYQAQKDFNIPKNTTSSTGYRQIWNILRNLIFSSNSLSDRILSIEVLLMQICARFVLAFHQLRDACIKLPVTSSHH